MIHDHLPAMIAELCQIRIVSADHRMELNFGLVEGGRKSLFRDRLPIEGRILIDPVLEILRRDAERRGAVQKFQRSSWLEPKPQWQVRLRCGSTEARQWSGRAAPDFVNRVCLLGREAVHGSVWRSADEGFGIVLTGTRVLDNSVWRVVEFILARIHRRSGNRV